MRILAAGWRQPSFIATVTHLLMALDITGDAASGKKRTLGKKIVCGQFIPNAINCNGAVINSGQEGMTANDQEQNLSRGDGD